MQSQIFRVAKNLRLKFVAKFSCLRSFKLPHLSGMQKNSARFKLMIQHRSSIREGKKNAITKFCISDRVKTNELGKSSKIAQQHAVRPEADGRKITWLRHGYGYKYRGPCCTSEQTVRKYLRQTRVTQ